MKIGAGRWKVSSLGRHSGHVVILIWAFAFVPVRFDGPRTEVPANAQRCPLFFAGDPSSLSEFRIEMSPIRSSLAPMIAPAPLR